jgi:hypothetical protein
MKGIVPRCLIGLALVRDWGQIEHHQEVRRPAQGKLYVTATAELA